MTIRVAAALAVLALWVARAEAQDAGAGAAPVAAPDPAGDAFRAATRQLAAGDLAAAQASFEAVAAMDPAGPWADDALSEAAEVAERRDDLAAARRLWRRVLDEHPSSRQARRARARLGEIERAIGAEGQWLAVAEQHEAILRAAVGKSDPTPQVHQMLELIEANPQYPRAHDSRIWIGDTWLRLGYPKRAAIVFRDARAAATEPEQRWRAGKALGDALAVADELDEAEATYRGLLGTGDALSDRVLHDALDEVALMRARARLILFAWIGLGLGLALVLVHARLAAGGVVAALRGLARPPMEVWFFVPIAALLLGISMSGNYLIERAVRWILLGGLVTSWLGGASLDLARRRGRLRPAIIAAHVAAAAIAVVSICYLAVMHDRLIDMLNETWQHGPER